MKISAIVAVTSNGVIGKDNEIPWYLPEDFKWFKKQTLNHAIIMGRKCFESIGRPLPNRTNIVVTRDMFYVATNTIIVHTVEEALQIAREIGETEAFIIGGGEIYRQTEVLWDRLYLTEVLTDIEGDISFSLPDMLQWNIVFEEKHQKDEKNQYDFIFKILEKKK